MDSCVSHEIFIHLNSAHIFNENIQFNSAVTVLNNLKVEDCENDEYSPVKVLDALTLHGWKISPEEQVRSTPMRFLFNISAEILVWCTHKRMGICCCCYFNSSNISCMFWNRMHMSCFMSSRRLCKTKSLSSQQWFRSLMLPVFW